MKVPASDWSRQPSSAKAPSPSSNEANAADILLQLDTEDLGINPSLLDKPPDLCAAQPVVKRRRVMSHPERPSEQGRRLGGSRGGTPSDVPAITMPEGRRSPSPATEPRYPRIFHPTELNVTSFSSTSHTTPIRGSSTIDPFSAYATSSHPHSRYLSVPGTEHSSSWTTSSASYPVPGSRTFQTASPAELHQSAPAPEYQSSRWPESNQGFYNEPSQVNYDMPASATSTHMGSAQLSPDFSPQNRFATLQPLQHRSTFPMYGPVATTPTSYASQEPSQPQPLSRSSTLPTPTIHPPEHSEAHTEQVIRNITRAQSGASDRGRRRSSAATTPLPQSATTPRPLEPSPNPSTSASASGSGDAGTDTDRQRPRCWEHNCNGKEFSTFSNLLRHQRERAGVSQKSSCPNCGAEFTRTTARNAHLRSAKCRPGGASSSGEGLGRGTSAESSS